MPPSGKYIPVFRLFIIAWGLLTIFHLVYLYFFLLFCFLFLLCSVNLQAVDQDRPLLMINLFWRTISEKEGWTGIS